MYHKKRLVLTLDAFGTLFNPKSPINQQYAAAAKNLGMRHVDQDVLKGSFKQAFRAEKNLHPNYGKQFNMTNRQWWYNVIERSFAPFVTATNPLPLKLQPELYNLFASAKAYQLYDDVLPFFQDVREHKQRAVAGVKKLWQWDDVMIGIISNSDDRIFNVLSDFGIRVAPRFVGSSTKGHTALESFEDINFLALSHNIGHSKPDPVIFNAAKVFAVSLTDEQHRDAQDLQDFRQPANQRASDGPYETVYCHVGDEIEADVKLETEAGWHSVSLDRNSPIKPVSRFRRLERGSTGPYSFEGHNLKTISQGLFDPTDESTYDAV